MSYIDSQLQPLLIHRQGEGATDTWNQLVREPKKMPVVDYRCECTAPHTWVVPRSIWFSSNVRRRRVVDGPVVEDFAVPLRDEIRL